MRSLSALRRQRHAERVDRLVLGDHAMLLARKCSCQVVLVAFRRRHDDPYFASVGGQTSHRLVDFCVRLVGARCKEPCASGEREREARGEWANRIQPLYEMSHVHPRFLPGNAVEMQGNLRASS